MLETPEDVAWHKKLNASSAKNIKKLAILLIRKSVEAIHDHVPSAPEVVFLMVYIRKFLDSDRRYSFPLVRFYCDWIVHVRKDRITDEIREVAQHLEDREYVSKFRKMEELREEFRRLLNKLHIPTLFVEEDHMWAKFAERLMVCLLDQPLVNPTANIEYVQFGLGDVGPGIIIKRRRKRVEAYAFVNIAINLDKHPEAEFETAEQLEARVLTAFKEARRAKNRRG